MKSKAYWKAQYEAQVVITEHHRQMEAALHERVAELEDAARARSLAEFRAVRPVAMQIPPEYDTREDWGYDPTGLVGGPLPELTAEEQAYVDRLDS